ncbi:MAG: hypothetical protein MHMPM18_004910 [Marteilia pararefringens]
MTEKEQPTGNKSIEDITNEDEYKSPLYRVKLRPIVRQEKVAKNLAIILALCLCFIRINFLDLPQSTCYSPTMLMPKSRIIKMLQSECDIRYLQALYEYEYSEAGHHVNNYNKNLNLKLHYLLVPLYCDFTLFVGKN